MPVRVYCFRPLSESAIEAPAENAKSENRSPASGMNSSARSSTDLFYKPQRSALTEALKKAGLAGCPIPVRRSMLTEALKKAELTRSDTN